MAYLGPGWTHPPGASHLPLRDGHRRRLKEARTGTVNAIDVDRAANTCRILGGAVQKNKGSGEKLAARAAIGHVQRVWGVLLAIALTACGSGAAHRPAASSTPTSGLPPTTTTSVPAGPAGGAYPAELPVVACPTTYGVSTGAHPFVARQLPADRDPEGMNFYSNGLLTVLGPSGWTCSALVATDGGQVLDVYPRGLPDLSTHQIAPGTPVVQVVGEYTGHGPGALLICPLFPHSPAATVMGGNPPCSSVPSGESVSALTNDVVLFRDPPGVRGTGAGSGGAMASTGAAVYPQVGSPDSVDVRLLSCTLPVAQDEICAAIQGDFLVRNPPYYNGSQS